MPIAPSLNDLLAQGQAEAQDKRPTLMFSEGDMTVADLHAAVAMADAVLRFAARAFRATFIDGAIGDELTTLCNDHLNLQRVEATAAQVIVSFSRSGGALEGGTIEAGSLVGTSFDASGAQVSFATDETILVAPGEIGPWTVSATAQITGPDGNVRAATVIQVVSTLFDPALVVTNVDPGGGGNLEESDEDLRVRARNWWQTLRRATLAAIEFGAKTVASVRVARVVEDELSGIVTLLVSDADGNSTLEMVKDVILAEEKWRAAGIVVNVVGGHPLVIDLELGLVVRKGFDVAALSATLVAAPAARMRKLRAGEGLYSDMVDSSIISMFPDDILSVRYLSVTKDGVALTAIPDPILPEQGQVIRPGTITVAEVS